MYGTVSEQKLKSLYSNKMKYETNFFFIREEFAFSSIPHSTKNKLGETRNKCCQK